MVVKTAASVGGLFHPCRHGRPAPPVVPSNLRGDPTPTMARCRTGVASRPPWSANSRRTFPAPKARGWRGCQISFDRGRGVGDVGPWVPL